MCIDPDSEIFVAVLAVAAALALTTFFNVKRLVDAVRGVSDERGWMEAMGDCGPALLTNGIWIFVAFLAARSCGVFL